MKSDLSRKNLTSLELLSKFAIIVTKQSKSIKCIVS